MLGAPSVSWQHKLLQKLESPLGPVGLYIYMYIKASSCTGERLQVNATSQKKNIYIYTYIQVPLRSCCDALGALGFMGTRAARWGAR